MASLQTQTAKAPASADAVQQEIQQFQQEPQQTQQEPRPQTPEPPLQPEPEEYPFASWMAEEKEACQQLTPFQFCFPGTHDSAATTTPLAQWVCGQHELVNYAAKVPWLCELVANWVVTQPNFGIYDQLRSGIRFIDLRIATTTVVEEDEKTAGGTGSRDEATSDTHSDDASSKDNEKESLLDKDGPAALDKDGPVALDKDGPAAQDKDGESQPASTAATQLAKDAKCAGTTKLILVHSFCVGWLDDAIADVIKFLEQHPTELIIINATPYFELDGEVGRKYLEDRLRKYACPIGKLVRLPAGNYADKEDAVGERLTVQGCIDAGHRVIFVWGKAHGDVESLQADTLWLYLEHLAFSYKSISLVDAKRDWLEHEVRNYCATSEPEQRAKSLYQLPYQVTPDAGSVVVDLCSRRNLADHAAVMNDTLEEFLCHNLEGDERSVINVVTVDNFKKSNVVKLCRRMLNERAVY